MHKCAALSGAAHFSFSECLMQYRLLLGTLQESRRQITYVVRVQDGIPPLSASMNWRPLESFLTI